MIYLKACNNLEENCSFLWKRLLRSGSGAYIAGTTDQIITNYSAQCKEMNYAKKICVLAWWVHESLFLFHKKLTHSTHKYYLFWRNSTLYIAAACLPVLVLSQFTILEFYLLSLSTSMFKVCLVLWEWWIYAEELSTCILPAQWLWAALV